MKLKFLKTRLNQKFLMSHQPLKFRLDHLFQSFRLYQKFHLAQKNHPNQKYQMNPFDLKCHLFQKYHP